MWIPALRRMAKLFVVICAGTIVLSVLAGLMLGASLMRSIAIGFYIVGCFVLFGAFFFGNRGPIRPGADKEMGGLLSITSRRWATKSEQEEAINSAAVFLPLGFVLILLGVVWDNKHSLF